MGGDDAAIPTPWATGMSQRKQSKSPARPTRHEDSSTGLSSASHQARPPKVASCDTPKRKRALTPAGTFARRVRSFLLWWALPYFLQRCSLESINEAAAGMHSITLLPHPNGLTGPASAHIVIRHFPDLRDFSLTHGPGFRL